MCWDDEDDELLEEGEDILEERMGYR